MSKSKMSESREVKKTFVVAVDGKLMDWFEGMEDAIAHFREKNLGSRGVLLKVLPNPSINNTELHLLKNSNSPGTL